MAIQRLHLVLLALLLLWGQASYAYSSQSALLPPFVGNASAMAMDMDCGHDCEPMPDACAEGQCLTGAGCGMTPVIGLPATQPLFEAGTVPLPPRGLITRILRSPPDIDKPPRA